MARSRSERVQTPRERPYTPVGFPIPAEATLSYAHARDVLRASLVYKLKTISLLMLFLFLFWLFGRAPVASSVASLGTRMVPQDGNVKAAVQRRGYSITFKPSLDASNNLTFDYGTHELINASFVPSPKSEIYCGAVSSQNLTTQNSPTIADCTSLYQSLLNDPGHWQISDWGTWFMFDILFTFSTCRLEMRRLSGDGNALYVRYLILEAERRVQVILVLTSA
jgi:hypothetical protein